MSGIDVLLSGHTHNRLEKPARVNGAVSSSPAVTVREIEVYPGQPAEWWFVPIATGRMADLHGGIAGKDGKTHAALGKVGEIMIE